MTHHKAGAEWTARGSRTVLHRSTPPATVRAWGRCRIATTRPGGRVTVATVPAVLCTQKVATVEQRWYEWRVAAPRTAGAQRHTLAVTTCFVPLCTWIGRGWHGQPIALARAAATLRDRFVALTSSVGSRGTGIPVAGTVLPAGPLPHSMLTTIERLATDPLAQLVHCYYIVDSSTLMMERHDESVPRKIAPSRRIARCA
ncbi:hypothetical protein [Chloroflexus sp.]|uniref:hypothetical protein n=1 Tax=Chloroflexus sp. TaxID=1904827 RepID=UPI002ACE1177|nr:hypothetical protein [Chloroflexus sp.]